MTATVAEQAISEADWQQQFTQLAKLLGWRFMHVRRSLGKGRKWTTATNVDGWPDLTLWSERHPGRVLFVELKSEAGRLRPAQEAVLGEMSRSGLEVYVLRPSDLGLAQRILAGETPR